MKKLNKHFIRITKSKNPTMRPLLQNVILDAVYGTLAATDSHRALEYYVDYNGNDSILFNPESFELVGGGDYPNIHKHISSVHRNWSFILNAEKIKAIHENLKANKKDIVLITTDDGKLCLEYNRGFGGISVPVSERYDTSIEIHFSAIYLFDIFDFLVDYVKEYKDAGIKFIIDSEIKPAMFVCDHVFSYLITPIRTR